MMKKEGLLNMVARKERSLFTTEVRFRLAYLPPQRSPQKEAVTLLVQQTKPSRGLKKKGLQAHSIERGFFHPGSTKRRIHQSVCGSPFQLRSAELRVRRLSCSFSWDSRQVC
jgi:hypothetical protein